MSKGRLEAFSDGVIAIILTIMVLELEVPHEPTFAALLELAPIFLSYVLSFVFIAVYWNNHHHLLQAVDSINGKVLWANMHLLFWLSLLPFVTAWMDENHFESLPVAIYGVVALMSAIAFTILARLLIAHAGKDSELARALGKDFKARFSLIFYAAAIPLAFVHPAITLILYVSVSAMWFIPDPRIERTHSEQPISSK